MPAFRVLFSNQIPVNLAATHCKPASPLLDERLCHLGLVRLPTQQNGACFLQAIAFTAHKRSLSDPHDATCFPTMSELDFWGRDLRQSIVADIRRWADDNPEEIPDCFQQISADPDYQHLSSFDDWLAGQACANCYTDETFMDFAAMYLGCQILSMWSSNGWWRVYPRDARLRGRLAPAATKAVPVVFIEAPRGETGHFEILATSAASFEDAHNFAGLDYSNDHAQLDTRQAAPSARQQSTGHAKTQGPGLSSEADSSQDHATAVQVAQAVATPKAAALATQQTMGPAREQKPVHSNIPGGSQDGAATFCISQPGAGAELRQDCTGSAAETTCASTRTAELHGPSHSGTNGARDSEANQQKRQASSEELAKCTLSDRCSADIASKKR